MLVDFISCVCAWSAPASAASGWRCGDSPSVSCSRGLLYSKCTHYNHLAFLTIKIYRFLCRILREKIGNFIVVLKMDNMR